MKKLSAFLIILVLLPTVFQATVWANNYQFGEEYSDGTFGKPTTSSVPADYSSTENVRRNKDAALFPPEYGVFGGDIPTGRTSPYHEPDENKSTVTQIPEFGGMGSGYGNEGSSTVNVNNSPASNSVSLPGSEPNTLASYDGISYTLQKTNVETASDGSIGRLSVPRFGFSEKVFEGSSNEVLRKGVGHFEGASQWGGNTALLAHNRGSYGYFYFVKDLKIGDEATYETSEGARTYQVYFKEKISEYDMSYLNYTDENILTLVTCVEGVPSLRWCAICSEKK